MNMQIRKERALAWQRYYDSALAARRNEDIDPAEAVSAGGDWDDGRLLEALMRRLIAMEEGRRNFGNARSNAIPSDIHVWVPEVPAQEQTEKPVNKIDTKRVAERYRKMASLMATRPSYH